MSSRSRAELLELLAQPNPHDIVDAADASRRERHGQKTTFVANTRIDLTASGRPYCPFTGAAALEGGFEKALDAIAPSATQVLLIADPDAAALRDACVRAKELATEGDLPRTVQVATASDWSRAFDAKELEAALQLARESKIGVLSDGVRPAIHPGLGEDSLEQWRALWRAAAAAGMRGQATVLYGPDHGLDSVFAQIDAIAALQEECGVFDAVAPVIYLEEKFGGAEDALSTQASFDLRVLAACRLGLESVEHLRCIYDRSDLKSAHTALLCGVDDLEGHLFMGQREKQEDAEAKDLSVSEMSRWLEEVGLEAHLRNGLYQSRRVPMQTSATSH